MLSDRQTSDSEDSSSLSAASSLGVSSVSNTPRRINRTFRQSSRTITPESQQISPLHRLGTDRGLRKACYLTVLWQTLIKHF